MIPSSWKSALKRRGPSLWQPVAFPAFVCALLACGGSTGREGLPQPTADGGSLDSSGDTTVPSADTGPPDAGMDATVTDAGSTDSAVDTTMPIVEASADDGGFDAEIQYADDARLADVGLPVAAGSADAGDGPAPWDLWPPCPLDSINLDDSGNPIEVDPEHPSAAVYVSGACATYRWTRTYPTTLHADSGAKDSGTLSCDECIRQNACGIGYAAAVTNGLTGIIPGVLPPCSDLRDAGTAAHGNGATKSFFSLCGALFECIERTGCVMDAPQVPPSVDNCYCGTSTGSTCLNGAAAGLCKNEIEEARQAVPTTTATEILSHMTDPSWQTGYAAEEVLSLFNCALHGQNPGCPMCFPSAGADGG